jgi:LysR family glycine cleavage system transcriptional activator
MNWSDLPSLGSLRAFAAVSETKNYTRAGQALNVTHGAVIQQVKTLERHLGVGLVVRDGRGVRLTPEGRLLAQDMSLGFASIFRGVENISAANANSPVQVTMSPAFAISWLMPRLVSFQKQHPEITLLLNPTSDVVELKPGGIDLAISYTDQRRPYAGDHTLLTVDMVVVGTPELVGKTPINNAAHLKRLPWLQELGTNEVADWMEMQGVSLERSLMISHMPGNLIMEAVRRGDGITYTPRPFVEADIRSGRLIELFNQTEFGIFYIRTGPGVMRPSVRSFVQWIKSQIADGNSSAAENI